MCRGASKLRPVPTSSRGRAAPDERRRVPRRVVFSGLLGGLGLALAALALCRGEAPAFSRPPAAPPVLALELPEADGQPPTLLQGAPVAFRLSLRYPVRSLPTDRPSANPANSGRVSDRLPAAYRGWTHLAEVELFAVRNGARSRILKNWGWRDGVSRFEVARCGVESEQTGRASILFQLPTRDSGAVKAGTYEAVAVLDTRATPGPERWRGLLRSVPLPFEVEEARTPGQQAEVLSRQAQDAFVAQDWGRAGSLAAEATRQSPGSADAWSQLGLASAARSRWREGIAAYERYLALGGPDDRDAPRRPSVRQRIDLMRRRMEIEGRNRRAG